MSRKIFSLLYGEKNKVFPNKKVIPSEDLGAIMEAQEVLTTVQSNAEQYKIDITAECEKLKEHAQKEGYDEGYQQWANYIALLEQEIKRVRGDLEKILVPVAIKAAKKIVGREIELSEETIADIVSQCLKSVSQHKKITIYVNKKDLDPLEKNRTRLKEIFESLEILSIRERSDIARGGCVIETEVGIINAQLENQWIALERAFSKLMKPEEVSSSKEDKPS